MSALLQSKQAQDLMRGLRAEELTAIPELPKELETLRVNLHPALAASDKWLIQESGCWKTYRLPKG